MSGEDVMMNTEQATELAALERVAKEGAVDELAAGADAPPAVDLAGELTGLVMLGVSVLSPAFPSLKDIYTPEATSVAMGAAASLCNKHGFLQGGLSNGYGEEIACLVTLGPMAVATYMGIKGDIEKRKADQQKAKDAPPQVQQVQQVTQSASTPSGGLTFSGAGAAA